MTDDPRTSRSTRIRTGLRRLFTLGASAAVLVGGAAIYWYLVENPNQVPRQPPQRTARLVETIDVAVGDYPVLLSAMGETIPATHVQLKPQVGGRIIWISPELLPGGRFEAGEEILRIDPSDYELALAQRESELRQAGSQIIAARAGLTIAERELSIERGSQNVAKREYELLGEQILEGDRSLVLREPQLLAAEAGVESAQAAIVSAEAAFAAAEHRRDQARVDLERTSIRAPFNAVVMQKNADVGDMVGMTTTVASLLGTDRVWVELAVPLSSTRWIATGAAGAGSGSRVEVHDPAAWADGVVREARVIQVLPQIAAGSRMARVLVDIEDPFSLAGRADPLPHLLVGSYVQARVFGPTLRGVIRLPRAVVWAGDVVRVMNDADELELRPVTVAFREPEYVLISGGLRAGERVVITNLATAVNGLPLRVAGEPPAPSPGADVEAGASR